MGHSGPCQLGAFAGKGLSTSELMLRVHHLCENRPARRLQEVPSRRSDTLSRTGTDCRLLVPISGSLQIRLGAALFQGPVKLLGSGLSGIPAQVSFLADRDGLPCALRPAFVIGRVVNYNVTLLRREHKLPSGSHGPGLWPSNKPSLT